ncbi:hypothetical protein D3C81_1862060 [compost metagenome]
MNPFCTGRDSQFGGNGDAEPCPYDGQNRKGIMQVVLNIQGLRGMLRYGIQQLLITADVYIGLPGQTFYRNGRFPAKAVIGGHQNVERVIE